MRVRYEFPVRGWLKLSETGKITRENWSFELKANLDTGYAEKLTIEVSQIPQDRWPTLSKVEQDANAGIPTFPFRVNSNVFSFSEFSAELINLESYLSIFGLEEIVFEQIKEEWIVEPDDDLSTGMQGGFERMAPDVGDSVINLTDDMFHVCAAAAATDNTSKLETAALAHFRVGQANFLKERYIESIRHLYLFIECLYGNGKYQKNTIVSEFLKSDFLIQSIHNSFFNGQDTDVLFLNVMITNNVRMSDFEARDFLKFLVDLRGKLQHASPKSVANWHPSRQYQYQNEATCLMILCDEIVDVIFTQRQNSLAEKYIQGRDKK